MDLQEHLAERLQAGLPLTERPFGDIAVELGCDEATVLCLTEQMIREGLIRSLGAFVDFERLGYEGLLCGLVVPAERIEEVTGALCDRREVTHAYLRGHEANLWCTALLKGERARFMEVLRGLRCPFVALRTEMRLKLRPTFRFSEREGDDEEFSVNLGTPGGPTSLSLAEVAEVCSEEDVAVLAALQRLPVVSRPFDGPTLERLRCLKRRGVLRRVGASLDHRRVGYGANALVAWDVGEGGRYGREKGERAARFSWVSHCYLREVLAGTLPFAWPWTLFTMLHARTEATLVTRVGEMKEVLACPAVVLPTVRELKKTRYVF
ncbi:MAG: hypothetical protein LBQ90_09160 [Synergistaceae bacterium]|jgi:DNA-binding Lrp family transcriptional regulator|nr:hypothetical protein [Synergistaceae bacterium]